MKRRQRSRALAYSAARTIRLDGAAWPVPLVNSEGLDEAREALEQFLARTPGFTSQTARLGAFRDEAVFQHWLEGLRKAGWEG